MKNIWKSLTAFVGASVLALSASMAQDSGALIDALVKKGVLSDQEGEEIRADLLKDFGTSSAGKLNLASHITQLKLYGDARYRYEIDRRVASDRFYAAPGTGAGVTTSAANAHPTQERDRNRFRLRFGAEYAFTDSFTSGIRLATGPLGNSTNADLGTAATGNGAFTSDGNGGNNNSRIGVDLLYLTYNKAFGQDWLSLTAGKQLLGQKFVQGWTWDSDINPEGGLIKLGDFKITDEFTISSTHGAYIYSGVTADNAYGAAPTVGGGDDVWMLINQVTFGIKPAKGYNIEITPGFVNYFGSTTNSTNFSGGAAAAANNAYQATSVMSPTKLNVFTTNINFEHPLPFDLKGKLYGDYGVNLTGASRASSTYYNDGGNGRNQFAIVGYQVGKGKGKGSWTTDATFAYQEQYSWDRNLTDSDWNGGSLNGVGFGVKFNYYFTDFLYTTINYRRSSVIDADSADSQLNGSNSAAGAAAATGGRVTKTDLVQVDLNWKF